LTRRRCTGAPSIAVVSRWVGCRTARRHPDRSAQPIPVIPTGATDGLIVRCAVEGPPHFAFVCSCRCLFLPLHVLAVVCSCRCLFFAFACSLFVIPQRSGICFCSRHCLFSTLPVLRLCLVLSEGAGGYSPGPFLVPLLPEGHAFTRAVSSPPLRLCVLDRASDRGRENNPLKNPSKSACQAPRRQKILLTNTN